jgi:hypothetical protein
MGKREATGKQDIPSRVTKQELTLHDENLEGQRAPKRNRWEEIGSHATVRAHAPGRFLEDYTAPLLYRHSYPARGAHETFETDYAFWTKCAGHLLKSVRFVGFRLTDWFPRAPGVYFSPSGIRARYRSYDRQASNDRELGRILNPSGKMALIEQGGVGTVRLRPRRIDNQDCWLATAVKGFHCAGGVPLAVPDALLRDTNVTWGDTVDLIGRVRFLQDVGLGDAAASVHHARPLIILVDEIEAQSAKRHLADPILISPVVLFEKAGSDHERYEDSQRRGDVGYTFVQCAAGDDGELDRVGEWVEKYAAKHGGRVITNFDEQRPLLADAPLSYQRLVKRTYERTVIEHLHLNGGKLADRIDHLVQENVMAVSVKLGDGTVIHGDFVVANSIRDSFNRVKESGGNKKLKQLVQQLTSQVGEMVEHLDPETAKKAADDLATLTQETVRAKPRREWWKLSLKGLKDAAVTVRDIGKPVVETVKVLAPLLAAASST